MSLHATGPFPSAATERVAVPRISPMLRRWFHRYTRRYVARQFAAVRVARGSVPACPDGEPVIVYLNHPSWWDPLVAVLLALHYFPERQHFAPIDAEQLERYRIFAKLGFFGVEKDTARGAKTFLTVSRAILACENSMLWITPQGRFADPRDRPPGLRSGLARLVKSLDRGRLWPLAIEYPFWDGPRPEVLARFGEPLAIDSTGQNGTWRDRLEAALIETQDALAAGARSRDASRFETVLERRRGMRGVYGLWQRVRQRGFL